MISNVYPPKPQGRSFRKAGGYFYNPPRICIEIVTMKHPLQPPKKTKMDNPRPFGPMVHF